MIRALFIITLVLLLALAVASPAFAAATGTGGAGQDFGLHHATHAEETGGFTGDMNPGVVHEGFSGWTGP